MAATGVSVVAATGGVAATAQADDPNVVTGEMVGVVAGVVGEQTAAGRAEAETAPTVIPRTVESALEVGPGVS